VLHAGDIIFRDRIEYVTDEKIVVGMSLLKQERLPDGSVFPEFGIDSVLIYCCHASIHEFVVFLTSTLASWFC
jgi:hypothetical protein